MAPPMVARFFDDGSGAKVSLAEVAFSVTRANSERMTPASTSARRGPRRSQDAGQVSGEVQDDAGADGVARHRCSPAPADQGRVAFAAYRMAVATSSAVRGNTTAIGGIR